jgi:hypothetical protein
MTNAHKDARTVKPGVCVFCGAELPVPRQRNQQGCEGCRTLPRNERVAARARAGWTRKRPLHVDVPAPLPTPSVEPGGRCTVRGCAYLAVIDGLCRGHRQDLDRIVSIMGCSLAQRSQ